MIKTRRATLALLVILSLSGPSGCSERPNSSKSPVSATSDLPLWGDFRNARPSCVKGIHLSSYYVGSKKGREKFEKLLAETEINTVVIDIKESEGELFIPGIKLAGKDNYVPAMKDIKEYLVFLKERGVYTIARQTVFHDNRIAKWKPEWAIHSSQPIPLAVEKGYRKDVWVDRKGSAWADPMNPEVWDYNIQIALKAAELGFQGVQFDYIRFPSDGKTKLCVYSKPHSSAAAVAALGTFLERAHSKLKPLGVELSIDVFGLVGSNDDDMGIGQRLSKLYTHVDAVSPMMYPSHYAPGEYGIKSPNASPYETIHRCIRDTKRMMKDPRVELRPYLQDFSLGVKYGPKEVRDQIQAANDLGIHEWLLWNPACRYTEGALLPNGN